MYNEQQKNQFLQTVNPKNFKTYRAIFNQSEISERAAGHDLCEFIYNEFLNLFEALQYSIAQSFRSYKTLINNYIVYCCDNKLCNSNSTVELSRLRYDDLQGYTKLRNEFFYNIDEMLDAVEYVFRFAEADETYYRPFQLYLSFLWVGLKDDEIYTLKVNDFDETHVITNGKYIYLPLRVRKILVACLNDDYFITTDGKTRRYRNNGYVFRTSRSDNPITVGWYTDKCIQWNKFVEALPVTDDLYGKRLSRRSIKKSAIFDEINQEFCGEIDNNRIPEFKEYINEKFEDRLKEESIKTAKVNYYKEYQKWYKYFSKIRYQNRIEE